LSTIKTNSENLARMKEQGLIAPAPATPAQRPPLPEHQAGNDLSRGQTPSSYSTDYDQIRSSETNAIPTVRIPPRPALANQQSNAASNSTTDRVVVPLYTAVAAAASSASGASSTAAAAQVTANAASTTAVAASSTAAAAQTTANAAQTTLATPALSAIGASGTVDPSKTYFATKGSIPPSISSQFPYVSTTTTITWEWAGQVVLRADGTTISIPDGTEAITGLIANQSYSSYPYYDEVSGTLKWLTNGDATFVTFPGVQTNGSTGLVTSTSSLTQPATFSIECWMQTAVGASTAGTFVEFNANHTGAVSTTAYGPYFGIQTSGFPVLNTGAGIGQAMNFNMLNDGQWHHLVFTGSGTTITLYQDGVFIDTLTSGTAASGFSGFWRIADGNKEGFFAGTIARVAIYTSQLTQAQVTNHYSAMYNSGTADYDTVVAADSPSYYWKLNETSGTSAADSAGSNTGTYTGGFTLNQTQTTVLASGTPAIAWSSPANQLSQAQNLQGRTPMSSGAMIAATPATGTGGGTGGGGGGGGGGCFTGDVEVMTEKGNVRFDQLKIGDRVLTAAGTYRPIQLIRVHSDYEDTVFALAGGGFVTSRHPILHQGRWTRAQNAFTDGVKFHGTVYNLVIDSLDRAPHHVFDDSTTTERSFILVNGLIAHNWMIPKK
jgi:hypothetical protein